VDDDTVITLAKTAAGQFQVAVDGDGAPDVIDLWLSVSAESHPSAASIGLTRMRVEGDDLWKAEQHFEVTEVTMTVKGKRYPRH
jgi:hypothetical protein